MIKNWISWILISIDKKLKLNLFQNMASKLISEDELKKYPQFAPNGVYILSMDGKLYDPNSWTSGATNAVGVALITDQCRFVIAPDEKDSMRWYNDNNVFIPTVFASNDTIISQLDFGGQENTHAAIGYFSQLDDIEIGPDDVPLSALGYCAQYTFKNGKKGYLGSVGEMMAIDQYYDKVNEAFGKIDSYFIMHGTIDNIAYWTSTQNNKMSAMAVKFGISAKNSINTNKTTQNAARPLCPLD